MKKSNSIIQEFNKLIKINPVVLNKSKSKCKSYQNYIYETKGVQSEIVRIYKDYKSGTNFAITLQGDIVKISTENSFNDYDPLYDYSYPLSKSDFDRKHKDLVELSKDEFHKELKTLLKILRKDKNKCNFNFVVEYFTELGIQLAWKEVFEVLEDWNGEVNENY